MHSFSSMSHFIWKSGERDGGRDGGREGRAGQVICEVSKTRQGKASCNGCW